MNDWGSVLLDVAMLTVLALAVGLALGFPDGIGNTISSFMVAMIG